MKKLLLALIALVFVLSACATTTPATVSPSMIQTAIAQTMVGWIQVQATPNVGRSSTQLPTLIPKSTLTIGPTGTPELGSLQNPYPMGFEGSAWKTSNTGVRSDFTIKVLQIVRGTKANDYMAPDYQVNAAQPPAPGMEWMLIQVDVALISGGELQSDGFDFVTISDGQVIQQGSIAQYNGPYPALNVDLLSSGHETGWLYTTVNIDDPKPLIAFGMSNGGSADTAAFFALVQ